MDRSTDLPDDIPLSGKKFRRADSSRAGVWERDAAVMAEASTNDLVDLCALPSWCSYRRFQLQRLHHRDTRQHRVAAAITDQHQDLDGGLGHPFCAGIILTR